MKSFKGGFAFVLSAYISWGLLPLYWKHLSYIASQEILVQRICWTILFLAALLAYRSQLSLSFCELIKWRSFLCVLTCACLTSLNWMTYLWATSHGQIIQSGLGYFISPMVVALLGIVFLGDRLSPAKLAALSLVVAGVCCKIFMYGEVPAVALVLAGTFAPYVTIRKIRGGDPVRNLFQELLLALPIVFVALKTLGLEVGQPHHDIATYSLLALMGPITAIPMLMLTSGMRTVSMQLVALAQFITPTLTLLMGLVVGEALRPGDFAALSLIWLGIALFCAVPYIKPLRVVPRRIMQLRLT